VVSSRRIIRSLSERSSAGCFEEIGSDVLEADPAVVIRPESTPSTDCNSLSSSEPDREQTPSLRRQYEVCVSCLFVTLSRLVLQLRQCVRDLKEGSRSMCWQRELKDRSEW
jgi:hypothetical protein